MDKFLVKPNKEKNKENMQMMNMKNEMKDIPSNHKDLKRIIRGYYGQLYVNNLTMWMK